MGTENNTLNEAPADLEQMDDKRAHPHIDHQLMDYYRELIDNKYKKQKLFANGLLDIYMKNKPFFSLPPAMLRPRFLEPKKDMFTICFSPANAHLFRLFYESTNRSENRAAEFIITSILVTFLSKGIDRITLTEDDELKLYKNNRLFKIPANG